MLFNIKKTKANLLAMNDEQLQTTTRLTILQNHQLTTELEHQSKQTEILIFKNNKMKAQIETLTREIEIHKEVEKELAKRSHFCQKVIKRLKQDLKEAVEGKDSHGDISGLGGRATDAAITSRSMGKSPIAKPGANMYLDADAKGSEDLINFLEGKLEQHEKSLVVKQQEYDTLQMDYSALQEKFNLTKQKYKRAALLMTEFLDDLLQNNKSILQPEKDLHLNIEKIKSVPIEELPKEDKVTLALVLLKQLQPFFSPQNLSLNPLVANKPANANLLGGKHNRAASGKANRSKRLIQTEDDGMNRILNNINVQTTKAADNGTTNLPPISQR